MQRIHIDMYIFSCNINDITSTFVQSASFLEWPH